MPPATGIIEGLPALTGDSSSSGVAIDLSDGQAHFAGVLKSCDLNTPAKTSTCRLQMGLRAVRLSDLTGDGSPIGLALEPTSCQAHFAGVLKSWDLNTPAATSTCRLQMDF